MFVVKLKSSLELEFMGQSSVRGRFRKLSIRLHKRTIVASER